MSYFRNFLSHQESASYVYTGAEGWSQLALQ